MFHLGTRSGSEIRQPGPHPELIVAMFHLGTRSGSSCRKQQLVDRMPGKWNRASSTDRGIGVCERLTHTLAVISGIS
jgi:hypothetical protein